MNRVCVEVNKKLLAKIAANAYVFRSEEFLCGAKGNVAPFVLANARPVGVH